MSKSAVLCGFFHICLRNSWRKTLSFVHWFVQVNRQKTTVKKKIIYFLKNYVASLFTFFEKVFRCKVLKTLIFLLAWSSIHSIGILFFTGRKYVDLVDISNIGRGRNFCGITARKVCICGYSGRGCGKMQTRITPDTDTFYAVYLYKITKAVST